MIPTQPDSALGHPGELVLRERLPGPYRWNEHALKGMIRPFVDRALAEFVEAQPFFFVATADAEGHCDASFRGREYNASGDPLPAVKVLDEGHLVFPDYPGNGLYNSLGNVVSNPHIGLLFVDFARQRRARINGTAEVIAATPDIRTVWPLAQAGVLVTVEQAYRNCAARIPRMTMVEASDG